MNGRIVFLLEEPSMKVLLETLLPCIFPGWSVKEHFLCIAHEGKRDLQSSIPIKLRAWQNDSDRFVLVQDKDQSDCRVLKQKLIDLCPENRRARTLVRIVCQELEAWYIGDLDALSKEFEESSLKNKDALKKYRDPDSLDKPSNILEKRLPTFQKLSAARRMGTILQPNSNRSKSFSNFITGIQKLAYEMDYSLPSGQTELNRS